MSTTAYNNVAQKLGGRKGVPYPVDQTGTFGFNQGDLLWYDISAFVLKALDSDAHANATLAGVALISSALALYANSQTLAANVNYETFAPVGFGDVFYLTGTTGETYQHGQNVYFGSSAQTVQKTTGSYKVGQVWLPSGNTLSGAVQLPILVGQSFIGAAYSI